MLAPHSAFSEHLSRPPTGARSRPLTHHERYSPNFPQPGVPASQLAVSIPPSDALVPAASAPPTAEHPALTYAPYSAPPPGQSALALISPKSAPPLTPASLQHYPDVVVPDRTLAVSTSSSVGDKWHNSSTLVALPAPSDEPPPALVMSGNGPIQGTWDPKAKIYVFKGIPYAAEPGGMLRFAKPEATGMWSSPYDCTSEVTQVRNVSPQRNRATNVMFDKQTGRVSGAEVKDSLKSSRSKASRRFASDCLYVDVWTGALGDEAKVRKRQVESPELRPVVVWLHHRMQTSPTSAEYDGVVMAQRGVVRVNVSYRAHVGVLKASDGCYNLGLYDIIEALKWIQAEIASFGGDCQNVTLCGDSAGAYSAVALMASPLAAGLFHKAAITSAPSHAFLTPDEADFIMANLMKVIGAEEGEQWDIESLAPFTDEDWEAAYTDPRFLAAMAQLNCFSSPGFGLKVLAEEAPYLHIDTLAMLVDSIMVLAVVDQELLEGPPLEVIGGGSASNIKLLVGYSATEVQTFTKDMSIDAAIILMPKSRDDLIEMLSAELHTMRGEHQQTPSVTAERVITLYEKQYKGKDLEASELWIHIASDIFTSASSIMLAEKTAACAPGSVWAFRFDGYQQLGSTSGHSCFAPLLHGTRMDRPTSDCRDEVGSYTWHSWFTLQEALIKTWLNFACYGDPNVASVKGLRAAPATPHKDYRGLGSKWLPYSARVSDVMVFDATAPHAMRATRLDGPQCTFEAEPMHGTEAVAALLDQHFRTPPRDLDWGDTPKPQGPQSNGLY